MANWILKGPYAFKEKLPSADVNDMDTYLTKVPNWVDGSDHTASTQVILRGAGLYVIGAFKADSAEVIIPSGKSFTSASGSTFTVNTLGTFSKGVSITHSTANSVALVATGNGTAEGATITGGATGRGASIQAGGGNSIGAYCTGAGTGPGVSALGGAGGKGGEFVAGGSNAVGVTATGAGSGAGATVTGGTTGVGIVATPGTASVAAIPQCAGQFAGFVEITADDPSAGVTPPASRHVIYGLSVCKAYCSVQVGTGGPYTKLDEHNIQSVTDLGVGNYQVLFLQPMPTTAYVVVLSTNFAGRGVISHTKTQNGFGITVYDTTTGLASSTVVTVDLLVFGRR